MLTKRLPKTKAVLSMDYLNYNPYYQSLSLIKRLIVKAITIYTNNSPTIHFDSILLGEDMEETKLLEIKEFQKVHYKIKSPYLLTDKHKELINEDNINRQSYHIIARTQGKIAGYIRLTIKDYELGSLMKLPAFIENNNYIELNRFLITGRSRHLSSLIIFKLGLFCLYNLKNKGFFAICKEKFSHKFCSFGLNKSSEKVFISYRSQEEYTLLHGSFDDVVRGTCNYFLTQFWRKK